MNKVFLLIGGNLGERQKNMDEARKQIAARIGKITKCSAIYETAAWGLTDQPDFYNQALMVETDLTPAQLMDVILKIEKDLGRVRLQRYGPRLIDIDILLYNHLILESPSVTIPHPRMQERRFVLAPLNEIAADYLHPLLGKTIQVLLETTPDNTPVKKLDL